jgi:iron(III) transport system substrate-binding protein
MRPLLIFSLLLLLACRVERVAPGGEGPASSAAPGPHGDVWVYTSMYRHVLDALDPVLQKALPQVTVHWFQAGSEKVTSRLEAEFAAGGTQCDLLLTSDPFLYERYKQEGRWLRYVSPNAVRVPRALMDDDGHFAALRLSTMVLVHKAGTEGPTSFAALSAPQWKGEVAIGDALTSGTAYTWAISMDEAHGAGFFQALRDNAVRVAGGNAAVLQKVEAGEAKVGVLLLENALTAKAKGSPVEVTWPEDGAVLIPGDVGILASTRNPEAARAVVDVLFSQEAQTVIAQLGDMHAVDPRVSGPRGLFGVEALLTRARPWSHATVEHGVTQGARVKDDFSRAFSH